MYANNRHMYKHDVNRHVYAAIYNLYIFEKTYDKTYVRHVCKVLKTYFPWKYTYNIISYIIPSLFCAQFMYIYFHKTLCCRWMVNAPSLLTLYIHVTNDRYQILSIDQDGGPEKGLLLMHGASGDELNLRIRTECVPAS